MHVEILWKCSRSRYFGRELFSPKQHQGIPWTSTTTSSTAFATICTLFYLSRLEAWDVSKLDAPLLPYLPYLVWKIRAYEWPNWTKDLWKRKNWTDMKITWRSWSVSQTLGRMSVCPLGLGLISWGLFITSFQSGRRCSQLCSVRILEDHFPSIQRSFKKIFGM